MIETRRLICFAAGWLGLVATPVFADVVLAQRKAEWLGTQALMQSMREGGYVVYFRHGLTNWSEKLREWRNTAERRFDLANCATQRNLSEEGREEARMIRFAMESMRLPVGRVYASQYCRPAEHVGIIAGKTPDERVFWLTGLGRPETIPRLKERVSTPPERGTNVILGDHGDLIYNVTDWVIGEGDAVVFRPEPPGFRFIAWIRPHEWLELARQMEAAEGPAQPRITAFAIDGPNPLGEAAAQATLAPHLGRPASVDVRYAAAASLKGALRDRGHGTWEVVPAPAGSDGRVRLAVRRVDVGQVRIATTPHAGEAHVRASIPALRDDAPVDTALLGRQLLVAARNPSRTLDVQYRPSTVPGRVDADVSINSRSPWIAEGFADNAGNAATGRARLGAALTHANVFDRGHVVSVAGAVLPDAPDATTQSGIAWTMPVPQAAGEVTAHWARSAIGFGALPGIASFTGAGRVAGLRYRHQAGLRRDYSAGITLGIEEKDYAGGGLAPPVTARPLTVGYDGHWEGQWLGWNYGVALSRNLPGGSANDDATYALARPDARAGWTTLRAEGDITRILTYDLRLIVRARAQYARAPLIAGEQFAAGGALAAWGGWPWGGTATVRGFEERTVTGDRGAVASVEFWSRRLVGHDLRVGAFVDLGYVSRERVASGQPASDTVASAGLAARWRLDRRIQVRADLAHVVDGTADRARGSHRFFAGIELAH